MEGVTSPPLVEGSAAHSSYFNPLMMSMVGVLVTSLAIITYHFLLKFYIRRHATSTTAAQRYATKHSPVGIDDKVLQTIPIVAFSKVKHDTDQFGECVVCLGDLEDEDMVRLLPNCKHAFHASCIDQWFAAHDNCPTCRSAIRDDTDAVQSPVLEQRNAGESPIPVQVDPGEYLDPDPGDDSDCCGTVESTAINSTGDKPSQIDQPSNLLRGYVSPGRSCTRLKRSQSMDRSVIIVDLQLNNSSPAGPGPGAGVIMSMRGSCSAPSQNHFDRASAKLLRSLSRLQMGNSRNGAILPY